MFVRKREKKRTIYNTTQRDLKPNKKTRKEKRRKKLKSGF